MKDLIIGKKFNKWTVIKREANSKSKHKMYLCRCECGRENIISKTTLINGKSTACFVCGHMTTEDLKVGQKFHKWTVLKKITTKKYLCKCDCGTIKEVNKKHLLDGVSKSCGCLRAKMLTETKSTHHKANTKLYKIYAGIKGRCYNKNNQDYKFYGGRGITMCDEWLADFMNFYNWAVNNGYKNSLSIDRINNNGNYEPTNCRWTTPKQQSNNTRRNVYITYNNETHTIAEWGRILNIDSKKIQARLKRHKNNFERLFYKGNLGNNGVDFL